MQLGKERATGFVADDQAAAAAGADLAADSTAADVSGAGQAPGPELAQAPAG